MSRQTQFNMFNGIRGQISSNFEDSPEIAAAKGTTWSRYPKIGTVDFQNLVDMVIPKYSVNP